jgi:hypothetical protein
MSAGNKEENAWVAAVTGDDTGGSLPDLARLLWDLSKRKDVNSRRRSATYPADRRDDETDSEGDSRGREDKTAVPVNGAEADRE